MRLEGEVEAKKEANFVVSKLWTSLGALVKHAVRHLDVCGRQNGPLNPPCFFRGFKACGRHHDKDKNNSNNNNNNNNDNSNNNEKNGNTKILNPLQQSTPTLGRVLGI